MTYSRSVLLVLGAMFAFAMMALFSREANAPVLTIAAWRAILVAAVFAVWAFYREGGLSALRPTGKMLRIGVPYGLFLGLASSTFVGGYAFTTVSNTIFFHNLAPVVAFPLAWRMFAEKPEEGALAGSAIALAGVALLSGVSAFHFTQFTDSRFLLGDLLAIVSAVGYAGVLVWTKLSRREQLPILGTLFLAWSVAAAALALVALAGGTLAISGQAFLWTLGLAVLCTNLPFYLLSIGMTQVTAGSAALLSMSEVLFATVLGAAVYGEGLSPAAWFGGLMVAVGVLYPFLGSPTVKARASLPSDPVLARGRVFRNALWLGLLNVGAMWAITTGDTLPAWLCAAALLRLGPLTIGRLLGGRLSALLRIGTGLGGLLVVLALLFKSLPLPVGSLPVALSALAVLCLDSWISEQEGGARDRSFSMRLALVSLAGAHLAAIAGHSALAVLHPASMLFAGLTAAGCCMRALQNQLWSSGDLSDRLGILFHPKRLAVLLALLYASGGIRMIEAGHMGVVERLGAPLEDSVGPGLAVRLPPPFETIQSIDVSGARRLELLDGSLPLLCGDQSMAAISATVHYRVSSAYAFAFGSSEPARILRQEARSIIADAVRQAGHEQLLSTGRSALESLVSQRLQERVDMLGIGLGIDAVLIGEATVPPSVRDDFLDVISASEDKVAAANRAEAYAAAAIPIALGEAAAANQNALGSALLVQSDAEAWRNRFNALDRGGKASPDLTRDRLRMEHLGERLRQPIIAPASIRIWLGGARLEDGGRK
jgi:regulator of protease activity HflC (stomatin/prohibitin superfamily)/drug/metabolite transporter (DMT)-like permease